MAMLVKIPRKAFEAALRKMVNAKPTPQAKIANWQKRLAHMTAFAHDPVTRHPQIGPANSSSKT
jgi:hypothetical protein